MLPLIPAYWWARGALTQKFKLAMLQADEQSSALVALMLDRRKGELLAGGWGRREKFSGHWWRLTPFCVCVKTLIVFQQDLVLLPNFLLASPTTSNWVR